MKITPEKEALIDILDIYKKEFKCHFFSMYNNKYFAVQYKMNSEKINFACIKNLNKNTIENTSLSNQSISDYELDMIGVSIVMCNDIIDYLEFSNEIFIPEIKMGNIFTLNYVKKFISNFDNNRKIRIKSSIYKNFYMGSNNKIILKYFLS